MSEQELVFKVKELHVLSLMCSTCGHGTIFDFKDTHYLEKDGHAQVLRLYDGVGGRSAGTVESVPLFLRQYVEM